MSSFLARFSAQLGKLDQKEINPPNITSRPTVVYSVECNAIINPKNISAKPHKLLINSKYIIFILSVMYGIIY